MPRLRVLLTTGGTAGHIFPALAVAEALRRLRPEVELLFVGGRGGPEERHAREAGVAFAGLPARGVVGRGLRALGAVYWVARGLVEALGLLRRFDPHVVAGFGGYASFCPVLAAGLTRRPVVLHEQNSVPGVVTRLLSRVARTVCVSFQEQQRRFGAKGVYTGNPVRAAIAAMRDGQAVDRPLRRRLLIVGGSQGAHALNVEVLRALKQLRAAGPQAVDIWHQTGQRDFEAVRQGYAERGVPLDGTHVRVEAFITEMAAAYAWADVVVCRSGASTVSELTVAGVPSVLVPFPHATHDHQTANARSLAEAGAAVLLPQGLLQSRGLAEVVLPLLDADRLAAMRRAALNLGRPDAALAVAEQIESLAPRRDAGRANPQGTPQGTQGAGA